MIFFTSHTNSKLLIIDGETISEFDFTTARGIDLNHNKIAISYNGKISIYETNNFNLIDEFSTNKNIHEISLQDDGSVICCDQNVSGLIKYNNSNAETYFTLSDDKTFPDGVAWISGMTVDDNIIPTHITALGIDQNKDERWRESAFNAQGALIDVNTGEKLLNDLFFPHSPRWINGELMFLNSGDGTIRRYVDGNSEIIGHEAGWLRGFSQIDSNTILVGTSARRHTALDNLQITDADATGVMVIDLPSMKQIDFIPWDVDEIFDIKYVP